MDQQRPAPNTSGHGFPFAPDASTLHGASHSRGNIMHDSPRLPGSDTAAPARLSGDGAVALKQALLNARQRWCCALVPARERRFHDGSEVADGGGFCCLPWILDALAERGVVLTRPDAAPACAPLPEVVGP